MNKFTSQFLKYIIILLVVGVILTAIGGISVGRTAMVNRKENALNASSKEKIEIISNENRELKKENSNLVAKNEFLTTEKDNAIKKSETLEAFILLEKAVKEKNEELAKECILAVDENLLPEVSKADFKKYKDKFES
ncbi:MAG: hypothetical protein IKJ06_05305 [Clostridia bacterium]|nr:hypothetical protein [Clostridia bacterium]